MRNNTMRTIALELAAAEGGTTARAVADASKASIHSACRMLLDLCEEGKLVRQGKRLEYRYVINGNAA